MKPKTETAIHLLIAFILMMIETENLIYIIIQGIAIISFLLLAVQSQKNEEEHLH